MTKTEIDLCHGYLSRLAEAQEWAKAEEEANGDGHALDNFSELVFNDNLNNPSFRKLLDAFEYLKRRKP